MYYIEELENVQIPDIWSQVYNIARKNGMPNLKRRDFHKLFLATIDNKKIIGFAGIACYYGHWCLRSCVIDKKHRGNSLQKFLINRRIDYLKCIGKNNCNAWVNPKNIYSLNNLIEEGFRFVKQPSRIFNGKEHLKLSKSF